MSNPFNRKATLDQRELDKRGARIEALNRDILYLLRENGDLSRECRVLHEEVSRNADLRHRHVWQIRKQQLTIERLKRVLTTMRADRNEAREKLELAEDQIIALNESLKARWADITQLTEQINFLNTQAREEAKA